MTPKRRKQVYGAVRRWRARNPKKCRAAELDWHKRNPAKMLVRAARRRAMRKGIQCTITWQDITPLPKICPVLKIRLKYGPGRGRRLYENKAAASLDRIHNSRGYVRGNVIVISLRANLLKGQASITELQKIAKFYRRYVS